LTIPIPYGILVSVNTRETIEQKALTLFVRKGYEGTGVQEVVDESGITKPTLYHYFGSKQGLLKAIVDPLFRDLAGAVEAAAAYEHDLQLNMQRVIAAYFACAVEQPLFFRLMLAMIHAPAESEAKAVARPHLERQYRILEDLFTMAAEDHGNMRGRRRAFAASFLGIIHTYAALYLEGDIRLDDRLLHEALRQFSHGIYS
jgi:TetR/AcrR family transcriptional regulator